MRWDYLCDSKRYGDAKYTGGLRNKMGRSFLRNHKICRMSRVVAYFTVRKLCARPNAHCLLRIYARNVATALVEFKSTSWTGATSVYSRNCESFIKYSCFCLTTCYKYFLSSLRIVNKAYRNSLKSRLRCLNMTFRWLFCKIIYELNDGLNECNLYHV